MPKNNLLDFRCVVWYLFVLKKTQRRDLNAEEAVDQRQYLPADG